ADPQRGLALSVAAPIAGRPAGRGEVDRAETLADAGAYGSVSAGVLSPALRPSISKSLDAGGDRGLRFGRVGKSDFPGGVIRKESGDGAQLSGQLHVGRARDLESPKRPGQGGPERPVGHEQSCRAGSWQEG